MGWREKEKEVCVRKGGIKDRESGFE